MLAYLASKKQFLKDLENLIKIFDKIKKDTNIYFIEFKIQINDDEKYNNILGTFDTDISHYKEKIIRRYI